MAKIVRLSESDLTRIVRRVISESADYALEQFKKNHPNLRGKWTEDGNNWIYEKNGQKIIIKGGPRLQVLGYDNLKRGEFERLKCNVKKYPTGSNEQIYCYYMSIAKKLEALG